MKIFKLETEKAKLPIDFFQLEEPVKQIFIQTHDEMSQEEAIELLSHLPEKGIAVVGTRMPQQRSVREVKRVISALKGSDLIIVSGFAVGIDTAAHQAALDVKLKTIAFLGGGFDQLYPHNVALRDRILDQRGIFISEYAPDVHPEPKYFLLRNRMIGGWTKTTWVVEAGYRSGALSTARHARDNHRTVYATPGYPGDPSLAGNQKLLELCHAKPVWSAKELGDEWIGLLSFLAKKEKKMTDSFVLELKKFIYENHPVSFSEMKLWSLKRGMTMDNFLAALQRV
jgi:DNA protecting protein DprA